MNINIIPAKKEDRDFFIHVHHTAYRDVIEKMFGWDEKLQDIKADEAFDGGGLNIIYVGASKAGVFGLEEYANYLWIKEIFLLPEFQNQGIGTRIIKDIIAQCAETKKDLKLRTLKDNLNAKRLYERLGFQVSDVTDIHWKMCLTYSRCLS